MDRRSVLVSSISLLSAKAALANTPQSLRTDIIGFWSLTEAVTIQGGDLIPWYGRRNPITGIITFFDNGWMAVQIAGARPGKVLRAEFPKLSPADKLDFLSSTMLTTVSLR